MTKDMFFSSLKGLPGESNINAKKIFLIIFDGLSQQKGACSPPPARKGKFFRLFPQVFDSLEAEG
jgi:hypothetical protein